jgi:hypothetical protein
MAPKRSSQSNWYRRSFCQTDRKFSAGRIVLSSDRLLRLIGDECWEQHLDTDRYGQEAQDWRDYERKQQFNKIRERICPAITTVAEQVRYVIRGAADALRFVESLPRKLRDEASILFNRLDQTQRDGGHLQVDRSVRDYGAMERGGSERFINRAETIHVVTGLDAALGPVPRLDEELKQALPYLYRAKHAILDTDWDSTGNAKAAKLIGSIETEIRFALRAITLSSAALNKAYDFLSPENVAGMVRWSSDGDCDLLLEDAFIERLSNGFRFQSKRNVLELSRPPTLVKGLLPNLDELRRFLE